MRTALSTLFFLASVVGMGCDTAAATAKQCEQTGGIWREVSECPSACAPPAPTAEACAMIEEMGCIAVCGDVAACRCPIEQPFWQEGVGCVGFDYCSESDSAEIEEDHHK